MSDGSSELEHIDFEYFVIMEVYDYHMHEVDYWRLSAKLKHGYSIVGATFI